METLSSTEVYASPWMTVREDRIRRPDWSTGICGVVERADIALIVPFRGDLLHLVEQYRHPVMGRCWEFPSGSVERDDADPAAAAARELREETGLEAGRLARLGTLDVMPSTLSQRCTVFLATDLTDGEARRDLDEQDMRAGWFTQSDIEEMVRDGAFTDAKSLAAYALLLMHTRVSPAQPAGTTP